MKEQNILSVDLGNGFIKATNGKEIINYVSSYIKSERTNVSDADIKELKVSLFNINSNSIYWGNEIQNPKYTSNTSDLTSSYSTMKNRYCMNEYYILLLATLTELHKVKSNEIILNLSLPTSDMTKDNFDKIKSYMIKEHITYKNGKKFNLNIIDINFYPQPFGSLLAVANGKTTEEKINEISENSFIVLDFGSGTTIIDVYIGGEIIKHKSLTIEKGQKNIYQNILNNINENSITISDIENSLKNKVNISIGNILVSYNDVFNIYQEELEIFLDSEIYAQLGHIHSNNERTKIILTGGGATSVLPNLKNTKLSEKLIIVENSQTASCLGMYEFATFIADNEG